MKAFWVLFLILSGTACQHSIIWDSNNKLKWEYFKGKQTTRKYAALTTYYIKDEIVSTSDSVCIVKIAAYFHTKKSWKSTLISDTLLLHEQCHFDIAELYARKFRNQVTLMSVKDLAQLKKEISIQKSVLLRSLKRFQKEYDSETNYSLDKSKQQQWLKEIEDSLRLYKNYSNPNVRIVLK